MKSEKLVAVRIKAEQARRIREIVGYMPGCGINAVAQRAVDQWLEIEGPVYLQKFKEAREILTRQAVTSISR